MISKEKIKKTNYFLFALLLVGVGALGLLNEWVQFQNLQYGNGINQNGGFRRSLLTGKALRKGVTSVEKADLDLENESEAEVMIKGNPLVLGDKKNIREEEKKEKIKFSFVAISDAESGEEKTGYNDELAGVLKGAKSNLPDFALFVGDVVNTGVGKNQENYKKIKGLRELIREYFNNYYFSFGQYDVGCGSKCVDYWKELLFDERRVEGEARKLYHSFDFHNTHFVLLSSNYLGKRLVDEDQLAWLENDLVKTDRENKIVVTHVSPVSFFEESAKGCHDMSCSGGVSDKLQRIFEENGVDLVLSGHENAFDHRIVHGVDYVLVGGIGGGRRHEEAIKGNVYSLIKIVDDKIFLTSLKDDGEMVRKIEVK